MAVEQLTFSSLKARQPVSAAAVVVNPSVARADQKRLKHQADVILDRLKAGPVWTSELVSIARQYNARIKEVREMLAERGMTVDCTFRGKDGNNRYELRPIAGSKYQAELMARQAKEINHE